jgi:hypothetical protein
MEIQSDPQAQTRMAPGHRLARGVCRHLDGFDFACLEEFSPTAGLRVDVLALGPKGEVWVIECKSGIADYRTDHKWRGYLDWCDRFFWAVGTDFPAEILPDETGLMIADDFDAEILRMGPEARLAPARRKAVVQAFARNAARRLRMFCDPGLAGLVR